jgi:hypothetical protein
VGAASDRALLARKSLARGTPPRGPSIANTSSPLVAFASQKK